VAATALTVAVVGLLTVTVQAGSSDQLPQTVEVLALLAGSALHVPQVVVLDFLVGSALQVPQVVEVLVVLAGSALQVPQDVEVLVVLAGSSLQVPQEVLVELLAASFVGSALQLLQAEFAPPLKPLVAELQVELVQVPKPLPKV
jgi:hypothetical protein